MRWSAIAAAVLASMADRPPTRTARGSRSPAGPSPSPEVPPVPLPSLDAQQQAGVAAIREALAAHPLSPALRPWRAYLEPVLLTNAWHESRFRADAGNVNDKESSHGLFQLNQAGGVGEGYSVEVLRDPVRNTTLILDELVRRFHSDEERARMQGARTVGDLVAAFAALVERPGSDRHPDGYEVQGRWQVGEARKATLMSWAPSVANVALPSIHAGLLPTGGRLA